MGGTSIKECCFPKNASKLVNNDLFLNINNSSSSSIKKIIFIQSIFRGFILRKEISYKLTKEISIDYDTEKFEKNPIIVKLNNLLPKFELTDKEEYLVKNSNHKIIAILYPNKSIYKGMVNEERQRDGFGKFFLSNGSIYKGFFHKNKMEGRGRILNINGFIYEGEFKNGKSNGFGRYIALDGCTYKGNWLNDKQSGNGYLIYPDGSFYVGNFKEGKKSGNGKFVFSDKNIYEGSFKDNEISGEGVFYWKDGRVYVGNWKNNKMNGYGIFIWADKKKYYGNYSNNLKEGFGCFYWNDGHKYEGFWKGGRQHGYGLINGNKGNKYGYWVEGKLENKINDDETIKIINQKINEAKKNKEYSLFQLKREKYEKMINDASSSYDTNFNSKEVKNNENNG